MRNRISQRPSVHNGREALLTSRSQEGQCLWCPPNHNENAHGARSKWGRKVAAKRFYATGKGRKEINWNKHPYWDLYDKHYESNEKRFSTLGAGWNECYY